MIAVLPEAIQTVQGNIVAETFMLNIISPLKKTRPGLTNKSEPLLTDWKRIMLPAISAPYSLRSVHAACRLAQECTSAEVRLVYVIEVPRSVALQAAMPVEDGMAEDALGAAVEVAALFGIHAHTEVIRVRDATEGIVKYVTQQSVDLLVLGARADNLRGLPLDQCRGLYQRVTCEVILNYIGTAS
jgi:nucleotide-binding universal stress UspA family protein